MGIADDAVDAAAVSLDPEWQWVVAYELALLAITGDLAGRIRRVIEPGQERPLGLGKGVEQFAS